MFSIKVLENKIFSDRKNWKDYFDIFWQIDDKNKGKIIYPAIECNKVQNIIIEFQEVLKKLVDECSACDHLCFDFPKDKNIDYNYG